MPNETAIQQKTGNSIKDVFMRPEVQAKFAELKGEKNAKIFVTTVLQAVASNKALATVDPMSIVFAAATAASLDLPVNQNLGFAYIVPYKDVAQFQMGYKGFIQLAQRSGLFERINATDVREGEIKNFNRMSGDIEFGWIQNPEERLNSPVVGYLGYFKLTNGFEKSLYMTIAELRQHGLKYSQSYKKGSGLWQDNFDAMAKKTVVKQLLSKYAPLSVEMQRAVLSDQSVVKDFDGNQLEYVDNGGDGKIDLVEQSKEKEGERIKIFIENATSEKKLKEVENEINTDELRALYVNKLTELKNEK